MILLDQLQLIATAWSDALQTPNFTLWLVLSAVFFVLVMYLETHGMEHSKKTIAPALNDILLDRLPVVDLNFLYVEVMGTLMTVFALYQLTMPQTVPFVFATLSLFTLVRRAFIIMTPLGPHPQFLHGHGFKQSREFMRKLFQGDNDFFFSGHTGLPFLFFLLTPWPPLAIIFLVASIGMGIAVLLMHIHYSIDVFAAPFMTYSIFVVARMLFGV